MDNFLRPNTTSLKTIPVHIDPYRQKIPLSPFTYSSSSSSSSIPIPLHCPPHLIPRLHNAPQLMHHDPIVRFLHIIPKRLALHTIYPVLNPSKRRIVQRRSITTTHLPPPAAVQCRWSAVPHRSAHDHRYRGVRRDVASRGAVRRGTAR